MSGDAPLETEVAAATTKPTKKQRRRKLLSRIVTIVVVAIVAVLFARSLSKNWTAVQEANLHPSWLHLLAILCFAFAVPVSGLLWGMILNRLSDEGSHVGARQAMAVHSLSWLLKYVPGQIGSVLSKVVWGQKNGFPRTLILITFIYENVFLQIASIVPSAIILVLVVGPTLVEGNVLTVVAVVVVMVPLVAILVPQVFHRIMSIASKRFLKAPLPEQYFLHPVASLGFSAAYVTPRVINGVGFILCAATVTTVTPGMWVPLAAAYALAGAIGILVIFVPSGIGVREAVLFVCLVGIGIAPGQAVVISVLSRLLSTVGDAVIALQYGALRLSLPKGSPA
ncbi:lysylphosphatidylglycerol synthase domain-containing protein [Frondihabitans sp. 4ASC-45]|uniref:lysylphosphatidylglycerol synthase domain-containing protein n=1 Tax=Frondihabitans sp. 4ASC-45 TaxID=3111636 RepID=UPI003C1B507F